MGSCLGLKRKKERKKEVDKAGSLGRSGQNPVPDRN